MHLFLAKFGGHYVLRSATMRYENYAYKLGLVMLGGFDVLALAGDTEQHLMHLFLAKFGGHYVLRSATMRYENSTCTLTLGDEFVDLRALEIFGNIKLHITHWFTLFCTSTTGC